MLKYKRDPIVRPARGSGFAPELKALEAPCRSLVLASQLVRVFHQFSHKSYLARQACDIFFNDLRHEGKL